MKCLQCGSERIVNNVRAADYWNLGESMEMRLQVRRNPDALFFKGTEEGCVRGNVCADCGFVMFSVSVRDARKLEVAKESQS